MKLNKLIIAGLATALFTACVSAKPGGDRPAKRTFAEVDTDEDGKVSLAEFIEGAKDEDKATKHFEKKDKDEDGFLSEEEFASKKKRKKGPKKKKDDE